jgi:hypothetical protein
LPVKIKQIAHQPVLIADDQLIQQPGVLALQPADTARFSCRTCSSTAVAEPDMAKKGANRGSGTHLIQLDARFPAEASVN